MSFAPNWVSAPGDTIIDILEDRNVSVEEFSNSINEDLDKVNELLSGNLRIESFLASKLVETLGFSEEFWIKRDQIFFQRSTELEQELLNKLPIVQMKKKKVIDNKLPLRDACFNFFGISNISDWNQNYRSQMNSLAFRKSDSFETDLFSIAVWVRQAEIATQNYPVAKWNKNLFEEKLITAIKPLSKVKNPKDFLPKLIKICADCGVKLAIVQTLGNNRASGATKFLDNSALMILSFRHLTDDHFWFTFFHEAGHLILHSDVKQLRIDTEIQGPINDEELEANLFAENCLIPFDMQQELLTLNSNKRKIVNFASKAGVSPGIIIGQMQFKKIISYSYLNSYKRRYDWDDIHLGIKNAMI